MPDEIPQTPTGPQVVSPVPPVETKPHVPSAPPATNLIVHGEVKSERELAIERREAEIARRESTVKDVETNLSDKERKIQEREAALRTPTPAPAPKKEKRRHFLSPLINTQGGED